MTDRKLTYLMFLVFAISIVILIVLMRIDPIRPQPNHESKLGKCYQVVDYSGKGNPSVVEVSCP
jgi:hypothetical protein